jgi:hypothetical protein
MEAALAVSRLLDRMELRPKVVGAQEIVGDREATGRIPLQEMKTAIAPKIRQELGQAANATPRAA